MPLHPLVGHDVVRNRLAAAVAAGRLPQALLFEGPRGVGKQRLALWLGQLLLCAAPESDGKAPCGRCQACRLVVTLSHPDLHWFVPVEVSKKGGDADKQVELVEEALGEEMAARRDEPLYRPPGGLAAHGIGSVRLLLKRLAVTPALGARKVFVVGDAERLVAQQGAEAAANALLKALEEPPADSVIVLTAAEPDALLPTILSRVVRVRLARVSDSIVTAFAQNVVGLTSKDAISQRVTAADGCIGKLLATPDAGSAKGEEQAGRVREAAAKGRGAGYALALGQMPFQARGGFTEMLDGLAGRLRAEARRGGETRKLVEAIARVMDARELAQRNVNPQLLAAVLVEDLAETP